MPEPLSQGSTGLCVKEMQAALNFQCSTLPSPLKPDGVFGPLTFARTCEFQRMARIKDDGIIGPITMGKLYTTIEGTTELRMTPMRLCPPSKISRYKMAPKMGFNIGALSLNPAFKYKPEVSDIPDIGLPPLALPKPGKMQSKVVKSPAFHVETSLTIDPLADNKKSPTYEYQFTMSHQLPWPVLLPKPAKLEFDFGASPLTSDWAIAAKLKVPFTEFKLPKAPIYSKGSFTPYFFAGPGFTQNGFKDFKMGAGGKLKLTFTEDPSKPYIPAFFIGADTGAKWALDPTSGKVKVKGMFQTTFGLEFKIPGI